MKLYLAPDTADMVANAADAADFLKKLAHPSRLMVVCAPVDGERAVRDLEDTLGIRQPGLSQQIAELREAGFITGRKKSKNMFYRLADARISAFISLLIGTNQGGDPRGQLGCRTFGPSALSYCPRKAAVYLVLQMPEIKGFDPRGHIPYVLRRIVCRRQLIVGPHE